MRDDNLIDVARLTKYHRSLEEKVLSKKADKRPLASDEDIDAILNGEIMATDADIQSLF